MEGRSEVKIDKKEAHETGGKDKITITMPLNSVTENQPYVWKGNA